MYQLFYHCKDIIDVILFCVFIQYLVFAVILLGVAEDSVTQPQHVLIRDIFLISQFFQL